MAKAKINILEHYKNKFAEYVAAYQLSNKGEDAAALESLREILDREYSIALGENPFEVENFGGSGKPVLTVESLASKVEELNKRGGLYPSLVMQLISSVETATRRLSPTAATHNTQAVPQTVTPDRKDNFLRRHWGKMLIGALAGIVAVVTLGLAVPAIAAIGIGSIGSGTFGGVAAGGAAGGAAVGAVIELNQDRKARKENSRPRLSARPSPASSSAAMSAGLEGRPAAASTASVTSERSPSPSAPSSPASGGSSFFAAADADAGGSKRPQLNREVAGPDGAPQIQTQPQPWAQTQPQSLVSSQS